MLPKAHIILGLIFSALLFIAGLDLFNATLVFLASFLIDFDHYVVAVLKTKKISLSRALKYHHEKGIFERNERLNGIRKKGDFHLFHTIEFHIIVFVAGLIFSPLLYVFIGMLFHSITDFISLYFEDYLYRREYFLLNWLVK